MEVRIRFVVSGAQGGKVRRLITSGYEETFWHDGNGQYLDCAVAT